MSDSIVTLRDEVARLRTRAANAQKSANERASELQDTAVQLVTAYSIEGFGLRDKFSIGGQDGITVLAVGGFLAREFVGGEMGRVLGNVGMSAAIIKAYEMGRERSETST